MDRVNWSVDRGDRWAVLGPNGAGKTTLLRVATGLLWPTGGTVRRLGSEPIDLGALRRSIGWISSDLVAQIPRREPAMRTVVAGRFAQVGFKDLPALQPTADDWQAARDQLQELDCEDLAERPFGVLSQGEKQKVLIARARMAQPLLLVLDEPCAGMDPGAREHLLATLERLAQVAADLTIIFVTHHVEEIMQGFDQVLIMQGGRVAAQGPTAQMITRKTLTDLYDAPIEEIVKSGGRYWPIWK